MPSVNTLHCQVGYAGASNKRKHTSNTASEYSVEHLAKRVRDGVILSDDEVNKDGINNGMVDKMVLGD